MARRTAMVELMRRAEPAPDVDEAVESARVAREAVRQSVEMMGTVLFGLGVAVGALFAEPFAIRLVGISGILFCLAGGVWALLNRQGARRALDANQRRWGPL